MTDFMGMIIESFVAILLMFTIGYCMMLNRRLKLLKGDEDTLRATIAELVTATEIAERAIAGLKLTARECDAGLGERLARAERLCAELDRKFTTGKDVLGHLVAGRIRRPADRGSQPAAAGRAGDRRGRAAPSPSGCAARCSVLPLARSMRGMTTMKRS